MKVAMGLAFALALMARAEEPLRVGGEVPDIDFKLVDGKELKLSDLAKEGKVVMVVSWSPSCGSNALDRVNEIVKKYAENKKVVPIGVCAYGDTAEEMKRYLKSKEMDYPVMHDADKAVSKKLGAKRVNSTYVVAEGKLFYRGGVMRNGKDKVADAIEAALGGKHAPESDTDKLG